MVEWKPAYGYVGLYEISDEGEIRQTIDHAPVKQSYSASKKGGWGAFVQVSLKNEQGSRKSERLARLVLMSFTPLDPPDLMKLYKALHKNDNELDNRLTNLYWGTAEDNMRDRRRNRLAREFGVQAEEIKDPNANPWQRTLDFDSPA